MVIPLAVLTVTLALALAAFAGGDGDTRDALPGEATDRGPSDPPDAQDRRPTDEQVALAEELARREEGDPLALGDVDAPVVMIEWADFQCPFCGAFARDTKPELVERFVDEGILRIEWRDFPIFGKESRMAAVAGRAAARQDAFWELHDAIYAVERERNAGELDREPLLELADDLDLDTARFTSDLDDPALEQATQDDLDLGQDLGITGTPAFLINGRPVMGGQPVEVFVAAIEQAAADASAS